MLPIIGKVYSFTGKMEHEHLCVGKVIEILDQGKTARVELDATPRGLDRLGTLEPGDIVSVWLEHAVATLQPSA